MIKENPTHQDINADFKLKFVEFLQTFKNKNNEQVYINKALNILQTQKTKTLVISLKDFMNGARQMCQVVTQQYFKHEPYLNEALASFIHQIERNKMINETNQVLRSDKNDKYNVAFQHIHSQELRSLKCQSLGKLIAFRGTVTRTTEVRPELITGIFRCNACRQLSDPVHQQFKYTQPKKCKTRNCDANKWEIQISKCQFADFQKLRVQEDPTSIPPGAMPRSLDVILRNQMTQKAQPGDICQFIGMLCVLPDISSMLRPGQKTQLITKNTQNKGNAIGMEGVTGLKQTGVRDLNYKLVFIANNVRVQNNQFNQVEDEDDQDQQQINADYSDERQKKRIRQKFTQKQIDMISKMFSDPNLYESLAESLFPSIYGHIQIKKAILLQLFSGIHKTTKSKINIRGDLNILIVGDPSTAKSQFLKSIQQFVPRSVYTSGKTTSAAGLTATVMRDQNGDVGIQAGALMLADNGVCCIDQFDKMDLKDQVAIHEAMQQQTISLAKAGIYATLNARTSILAAANPKFGRYDKSKSLKSNIQLSAPIMSRFDLFFVICDQSNDLSDENVSKFLINMHKNKDRALQVKYKKQEIKKYIQFGKKFRPRLTKQAAQTLRSYYKSLRVKDKNTKNTSYPITVRQLESMIRLSEALARLHLSFEIQKQYVIQAYRLLTTSILKLQKPDIQLTDLGENFENLAISGVLNKRTDKNIMEQQFKNNQNEKKKKSISMSYEVYEDWQKKIYKLLREREKQYVRNNLTDQPFGLVQNQIVDFLLAEASDQITSTDQIQPMKKVINALIKLLVQKQRSIVVIQENTDIESRILGIHPNFIQ